MKTSSLKWIVFCLIAGSLLHTIRCTTSHATGPGGTGSETVIGKIMQQDGLPARKTVVFLYPQDFDPLVNQEDAKMYCDTTDNLGWYVIPVKPTSIMKKYRLEAVSLLDRTRSIVSDIDISGSGESTYVNTASLHYTGSIKVFTQDSSKVDKGYVFIPGTSYYSYFENGCALIDSVPEETVLQVCYKPAIGEPQNILSNVDVKGDITTVISFSAVANRRTIYLNTTSAGADVNENLIGFTVLLRLTYNNFDFAGARTGGSDLRLTKKNDSPLPFEIERWDVSAMQAEIWVKLDTIYGNDSSQCIVMYWGDAASEMPRSKSAVFDTAEGFRGVWHLAEESAGTGTKNLFKDATGRNNGDDFISTADRSGKIGYGHAFDGIDDYIHIQSQVTNFLKGDGTIALWVNIADSGGTILSKLDTSATWNKGGVSFYFGDGTDTNEPPGVNGSRPSFVGFHDDYAIAAQAVPPDSWHFLVYTWEWNGDSTGTSHYYIDGENVALSRDSLVIRMDENNNATLRIGQPNNNESYAYFNGSMDELEISSVVRSAAWIKLSYVNQESDSVLLRYTDR